MSNKVTKSRDALHEKLNALLKKNLPVEQAELIAKFLHQYYATISIDDLMSLNLMDIYGSLLSHWQLFYQRAPNEVKIRIYNPEFEKHGWKSTHTIIEIAQDDMPFLVDSIQMELNRRNLTTHSVIHVGGLKVIRNGDNNITEIYSPGPTTEKCAKEAVIFIAIDRQTEAGAIGELEKSISEIINDVRYTVEDWKKMLTQVDNVLVELEKTPPPVSQERHA